MMIHLYTCCYNEIEILPFVIDYWKKSVDFVFVYDNFSTDGSRELLSKYDWIKIIDYDSNNKLNDYKLLDIKNNEWKKSIGKTDYVIVCDIDECVYCEKLDNYLTKMKNEDIMGVIPNMYNLISNDFPKYNNKLMHEIVKKYYFDMWEDFEKDKNGMKSKLMLFDPNKMEETNYKVGCYEFNPVGNGKIIKSDDIRCYHLHDVGLYRKIIRYNERSKRMSDENIKDHLSDFYLENVIKIIYDFKDDLKNAKDLK